MAYSTQADLLNRITEPELVQLTDDSNTGMVDAAKVTEAIAWADGQVDAKAGSRYTLPLAASAQVRGLSADLAVFFLEKRRARIRAVTQQRHDNAIALLERIEKGEGLLSGQASGQDVKRQEEDDQVFSKDNLEGL